MNTFKEPLLKRLDEATVVVLTEDGTTYILTAQAVKPECSCYYVGSNNCGAHSSPPVRLDILKGEKGTKEGTRHRVSSRKWNRGAV